jgi:hypothetical protein
MVGDVASLSDLIHNVLESLGDIALGLQLIDVVDEALAWGTPSLIHSDVHENLAAHHF